LRRFLLSLGLKPSFASNGSEALPLVQKLSPTLVILDIYMPRKDGLAVLRDLNRQYPAGLPFGVILVTGCIDERLLQEALQLGAFDLVPKPIQFEHLELAIRTKLLLSDRSGAKGGAEVGDLRHVYKERVIQPSSYQNDIGQWIPLAHIVDPVYEARLHSVSGTLPYTAQSFADAAATILAKTWIDTQ
jgi:CheY-like chemotaxis protein